MTHIVVSGSTILGTAVHSEVLPDGDTLADGIVYPASVPGWSIVDTGAALPPGFSPSAYIWQSGALIKAPDTSAQIAAVISAKLDSLAAYTEDRQGQNVTIAAVGGFPTSFASNWLGLINGAYLAAQADSGFTTQWQDVTNAIHTLSAAQVISLWRAGTAYINACFAAQSGHAANIRALTTVSAVAGYDFTQGWPSTSL